MDKAYEKLFPHEEFSRMKVVQYQDIAVSKDMACPECGGSNQFTYSFDKSVAEPVPVGWCDTDHGFMAVFECPRCFTRFRFHISTGGRYDEDRFYADFALLVHLYRHHQVENN